MDPKAHRLPATIRPRLYDIHLTADREAPTFSGTVRIELDLTAPASEVELHARGLTIKDASLEQDGKGHYANVSTDAERETATFHAAAPLAPGKALLTIAYEGPVATNMAGLYLSKDGDEVCLATQCEATDARAILPCFDEPEFKARFQWTVTAPLDCIVLTNGKQIGHDEHHGKGTATWRFAPTPPVSSYLLAVAIGPFGATPAKRVTNVPFQVYALGGKERLGLHGRDFAARLMPWYERYFGVPYPFGKYDQVAVPSFSFGAMENPGLIVFRASLLLMDAATASWREKKSIDLVVAHEFAHMWFGDLVTMRWWDDLWLNEAFAEWICHKAVDELEPSHEVWHDFAQRTGGALRTDALSQTHAIYHPVKTPAEASELFDAITYGKGSATLRMLESYLGAEPFCAGLRTYMDAFSYRNAAGPDLWQHLGKASNQPVDAIMESWIKQPGHPTVSYRVEATKDGARVHLAQKRARSSPLAPTFDQTWKVPVVLAWADAKGKHETRYLLDGIEGAVPLPAQGGVHWCHANREDIGFYRTDADDAAFDGLVRSFGELSPAERRGLVRDQWELVRSGDRPVRRFLDMLKSVAPQEMHYTVLDETVGVLRELERLLETKDEKDALAALRRWTAAVHRPRYDALGLAPATGEPPQIAAARAAVVRAVASIGREPQAVEDMRRLAARERDAPASVDANLAGIAVGVTAAFADAAGFDRHVATYKQRRDAHAAPQEVDRYLYSLGAFRDPALVQRTLALLGQDVLPAQSVGPVLRIMLGEPHSQRAAWTHIQAAWSDIRTKLGDPWTANLVEAAGSLPPELAGDVTSFFDANLGEVGQQSYGRAKERLAQRSELQARVLPVLTAWTQTL